MKIEKKNYVVYGKLMSGMEIKSKKKTKITARNIIKNIINGLLK